MFDPLESHISADLRKMNIYGDLCWHCTHVGMERKEVIRRIRTGITPTFEVMVGGLCKFFYNNNIVPCQELCNRKSINSS